MVSSFTLPLVGNGRKGGGNWKPRLVGSELQPASSRSGMPLTNNKINLDPTFGSDGLEKGEKAFQEDKLSLSDLNCTLKRSLETNPSATPMRKTRVKANAIAIARG